MQMNIQTTEAGFWIPFSTPLPKSDLPLELLHKTTSTPGFSRAISSPLLSGLTAYNRTNFGHLLEEPEQDSVETSFRLNDLVFSHFSGILFGFGEQGKMEWPYLKPKLKSDTE